MRRFGERFGETLRMALGIATVLSLWVLLLMVINSGTELTVRGRAYSGFVVIAIYYLGGGLAALIVAALLPLTRHPAGAAVVGVLSALPVTLAVVVGADGVGSLGSDDCVTAVIAAVALGGLLGLGFRKMFAKHEEGSRESRPSAHD